MDRDDYTLKRILRQNYDRHSVPYDSHKHSPEHDSNELGLQDAAYAGPEVPVMCQCGQATTHRMPMQMLMMKKVQMDTTTLCHCVSFRFCGVRTGVTESCLPQLNISGLAGALPHM